MSLIKDVENFLREFKTIAKVFPPVTISPRTKNSPQRLAEIGITASIRTDMIMGLEPIDYCEGPKSEVFHNCDEMWVFGKIHNGTEIYIKIAISKNPSAAICISFHVAEYPLNFPLKK